MTVSEALNKMQEVVEAAKNRLEGNGFVMSVETEYLSTMFRALPDEKKASYVTVFLIVGKEGGAEGEEYCLSLGASIFKHSVDGEKLAQDIESYEELVNNTVETLAEYENKDEGLDYLTKKASEEYEERMAKVREVQEKNRKISRIVNAAFLIGLVILFIILSLYK